MLWERGVELLWERHGRVSTQPALDTVGSAVLAPMGALGKGADVWATEKRVPLRKGGWSSMLVPWGDGCSSH